MREMTEREKITIKIDGIDHDCCAGDRLMDVLSQADIAFSPLCYHPQLHNETKAHLCWIEVEGGEKPVEACGLSAVAGMHIKTRSEAVKRQVAKALRYMNAHHPPECFSCEKTGNCALQMATFMHGGTEDAVGMVGATYRQKSLNALVNLYPDRCIQCGLCTAFSAEVMGTSQLQLCHTQKGFEIDLAYGGQMDFGLSGNLTDLCPSGAIVKKVETELVQDQDIKKYPAIDVMDGCGGKVFLGVHGGKVVDVSARVDAKQNHFWVTDKARFSWDGLTQNRILSPMMKKEGKLEPVSWIDAFKAVVRKMADLKPEEMAFLAGQIVDVETLYLLKELLDDMGVYNRDILSRPSGLSHKARGDYVFNTTFSKIQEADACLIIGHHVEDDAMLLQAHLHPLFGHRPDKIATLGIESDIYPSLGGFGELVALSSKKHPFFKTLSEAKNPLIIVGASCLEGEEGALIYKLSRALAEKAGCVREDWNGFNILHPSITTVGGIDVGFLPREEGLDYAGIKRMARGRRIKFLYLLNADDLPFGSLNDTFIVYQGHHMDKGAQNADVVLPGCAYPEKSGIYVNTEGRPSFVEKVVPRVGEAKEDWKIIRALSEVLGHRLPYNTHEQIFEAVQASSPAFKEMDSVIESDLSTLSETKKTPTRQYTAPPSFFSNGILNASSRLNACLKKGGRRK